MNYGLRAIRVNPEALPIGDTEVIPFKPEYLRQLHKQIKAYRRTYTSKRCTSHTTINYPEQERSVSLPL
jgi:hypothetical protein